MITELIKFKEIEKLIALLSINISILLSICYISSNCIVRSETTIYNGTNTFYLGLILFLVFILIIFFKFSVSQLIKVLFNDKQVKV